MPLLLATTSLSLGTSFTLSDIAKNYTIKKNLNQFFNFCGFEDFFWQRFALCSRNYCLLLRNYGQNRFPVFPVKLGKNVIQCQNRPYAALYCKILKFCKLQRQNRHSLLSP